MYLYIRLAYGGPNACAFVHAEAVSSLVRAARVHFLSGLGDARYTSGLWAIVGPDVEDIFWIVVDST